MPFDVDTSSYPKPSIQTSPLDIAGKLGGLQSQALGINQQKLDQANQALQYLSRSLAAIGPNASKDEYKRAGSDAAKTLGIPENTLSVWNKKIDDAPDSQTFFKETMGQLANHSELVGFHLGQNQPVPTAQGTRFFRLPTAPGSQPTETLQVKQGLPPTQPMVGARGQPTVLGDEPMLPAPGASNRLGASLPPPLPPGPMNPAMVPGMRPGETAISADVEPAQVTRRPGGPVDTGFPIGTEQGLEQFTNDQKLATQKMTAVKPLVLAWPKILELERSGPGTPQWNDAVAFMKTWNIIPTRTNDKDATQVYQEVNKYMNQYISRSGNRSDAEQSQKEMSNPNIGKQILPALKNLTKNTVAQDRIEAARAGAFESRDFSKYGEHASQFPQSMHNEAAAMDFLPPKDQKAKFDEMLSKAKSGDRNAIKFIKTLAIMNKQKMHELNIE